MLFRSHAGNAALPELPSVQKIRDAEKDYGLYGLDAYRAFAASTVKIKCDLLRFLIQARAEGKVVAGYGAPAKGNTLLNYCGVGPELIPFTVDRSHHKQGHLLPGVRIPIKAPQAILDARPDYVLILPWNFKDEIVEQMAAIREWGGKFVVPIPELKVL